MRIVDNQTTRLIDEIRAAVTENTVVHLSCSYFTAFALYELLDVLKKAKHVKVLLNRKADEQPFQLIQSDAEAPLNLELDRPYRIRQVI
ncbi:MAG: hypothetical protein IPI05_05555, partial [Flavobacteriales bacterium]|nr:hypothetical protein [Flavobacteriales bacterium]